MEWLLPISAGVTAGLLMSLLLGVVFFLLIHAGLNEGYKKGYLIAAGVITGDTLFVILALFFTQKIQAFIQTNQQTIAFIGGAFLIFMGFAYVLRKPKVNDTNTRKFNSLSDFYIKPLVINLLNPANAMWWLGLYSTAPAATFSFNGKIIFAIAAIFTIFWTEVGVAFFAQKLKPFINEKYLSKLNHVLGMIFILLGLILILKFCF